jgi:CheY-like chemotaxis protein
MLAKRVLAVDDDVPSLEGLCALLRAWAYEPEAATSRGEAIAVFRKRHPPLVVMDLGLPDGDAVDLIREMKAEDPATRIIAFSGLEHLDARALAAGAHAFVLKPDVEQLESLVLRHAPLPGAREGAPRHGAGGGEEVFDQLITFERVELVQRDDLGLRCRIAERVVWIGNLQWQPGTTINLPLGDRLVLQREDAAQLGLIGW